MKRNKNISIVKVEKMKKELLQVPRATLDIYKSSDNGITIYEFDATECSPPEPMVNTIVALQLLKNENDSLVVTYFHQPTPLFQRVELKFSYICKELENGDVEVTFQKKATS